MNCSRISALEHLASALAVGARLELYLTPKPGLVDLSDNGSHPDLSVDIMERSVAFVSDFLAETVRSLQRGEPFSRQKQLGIRAEQRLYDELATNTHKGYIFLSGMLLIAFWHSPSTAQDDVRRTLSALCADFFRQAETKPTHGLAARTKYSAGGIVQEAVDGFPSLYLAALPAFRESYAATRDFKTASLAMMARLMQTVDDTTTLHRAGPDGLARVRRDGSELARRLDEGGEVLAYLTELNAGYVEDNITIGGVADMIGMSYGVLIAQGDLSEQLIDEVIRRLGR